MLMFKTQELVYVGIESLNFIIKQIKTKKKNTKSNL